MNNNSQNKVEKRKIIGAVSLGIGIGLFIFSIISAWIVTPEFMQLGEDYWPTVGIPGKIFGYFWALSFPIGSILIFLGVLTRINVESKRILIYLVSILVSIFIIINIDINRSSLFFGVGGILIEIFLIMILWYWGKNRVYLEKEEKTIGDLRIIGYLFLALATWFMCGLGAMIMFATNAETITLFVTSTETQVNMISIQYKIMICLIIGWFFISFSYLKSNLIRMKKSEKKIL